MDSYPELDAQVGVLDFDYLCPYDGAPTTMLNESEGNYTRVCTQCDWVPVRVIELERVELHG